MDASPRRVAGNFSLGDGVGPLGRTVIMPLV
jgi:hypothetical protein